MGLNLAIVSHVQPFLPHSPWDYKSWGLEVKEAKGSGKEIPVSVCIYARADAVGIRRGCVEDDGFVLKGKRIAEMIFPHPPAQALAVGSFPR